MKKLIVFLMISFSALPSFAETPRQKSALEYVLEEMTKQYLENTVKNEAMKQLESAASRALATDLSGSLSSTLAVLSLIDSIQQYDKATSETGRYQAFAQGVAAATTLANPAIGALVSLGVMAQGMNAALISKQYSLDLAKLIAEISAIENTTSEIIKKDFLAEEAHFKKLLARSAALSVLLKENSDAMDISCKDLNDHPVNLKPCLKDALLQQNLFFHQVRTVSKIITFNGRFIQTAAGITPEFAAEMTSLAADADKNWKANDKFIRQTVLAMQEMMAQAIRSAAERYGHHFRCERMIFNKLNSLLSLVSELQSNGPDESLTYFIEDDQESLRILVTQSCATEFKSMRSDLKNLVKRYVPELMAKDMTDQTKNLFRF